MVTTRQTGPRPASGEQFEIHRGTAAGAAKAVVGQVVAAVLRDMQLDITEVGRYTAIHGLLRNTGYAATEQSADSVTLAASIYPQHGYLFNRDTTVTYTPADDAAGVVGLHVTHTLTNTPSDFAGHGPTTRLAVAVEPTTCGANALRNGIDVITLPPDETCSASWGLTPLSA